MFKLIDEYSVNKSSREVTFSSLKIDFTDKTVDDLPCKYQETRIWQCYNETECLNGNGKILFTTSSIMAILFKKISFLR